MNTEKKLLQVGDKIAEKGNYGIVSIMTVTRVTATQAMAMLSTGNEKKFKREYYDSYVREMDGQKWSHLSYSIATEADAKALKLKLRIERIKKTDWSKLPADVLEQVYQLVNQAKPNQ